MKQPFNVVSYFDGVSCGRLALEKAGIKVDNYFAAEIENNAVKVTQHQFPNTIQLGDVKQINIKTLPLSEVHDYLNSKYFSNDIQGLQSYISEREMLHRIDKEYAFAAYFGTQIPHESGEVSENTILSVNDRIWFFKHPVGDCKGQYDLIRSGERGKRTNQIDVGELCKHSFWWNGDRQHQSEITSEGIEGTNGTKNNKPDKRKITKGGKHTVHVSGSEGEQQNQGYSRTQRPNRTSELFNGYVENRPKGSSEEKENNRGKEKTDNVFESSENIQATDEMDGVTKNKRVIVQIYKKIQATVVECEWGIIVLKGVLDYFQGGSPCTDLSIGGKRNGMSTECNIDITSLEQYLQLKQENFQFEGQSYLFWEYVRALKALQPKYFFLENVPMEKKWETIITRTLGVNPICFNSSLVSAQNRDRLYWTNIGLEPQGLFGELYSVIQPPKNKNLVIRDIRQPEEEVAEKYYLSEKALQGMIRRNEAHKAKGNGFAMDITENDEQSNTILARYGKDGKECLLKIDRDGFPKANQDKSVTLTTGGHSGGNHSDMDLLIVHTAPKQVASLYENNAQAGRIYSQDGKSVSITANGGGLGGKTGLYEMEQPQKKREIIQLNPSKESGGQQPYQQNGIYDQDGISPALQAELGGDRNYLINTYRVRRLTPIEVCRLQTIPDTHFFDDEGKQLISDTQIYKCAGNGWTVDMIAHIFSYIK